MEISRKLKQEEISLLKKAQEYLNRLSSTRLQIAVDFLAFLQENEPDGEPLGIPPRFKDD